MKREVLFAAAILAVVVGAAGLRLVSLDNRPMHCDEAVHAVKFGKLLESDDYVYDPHEYHGPSLNFLALPIARLASSEKLTEVTETQLRLLPAVFGILLVGSVWLLRRELGFGAAFCACLFTAVSPAMVFYSRYYVQEMLLVAFSFGAIVAFWRYRRELAAETTGSTTRRGSRTRQVLWLVILGLCIGMMHASKETCVIALFAMAVAALSTLGLTRLVRGGWRKSDTRRPSEDSDTHGCYFPTRRRIILSVIVVSVVAASTSALLFSSFFDNPKGVADSVTTYFHYLGRASGEGSVGRHVYPWDYYYQALFFWHEGNGPIRPELPIAVLSLAGLIVAVASKARHRAGLALTRFLAVYTLCMMLVYTVMPYKTPWCALGFLHGLILLAGVGAAAMVRAAPGLFAKTMVISLLAIAVGHLSVQTWLASFVSYEDPHNPFVYAHTTDDVPQFVEHVRQIAAAGADGKAMHIQVICPDHDYWPLPWYMRDFPNVGWHGDAPDGPPAGLIITQPAMEPLLLEYLYVKQPPGQRYLYVPLSQEEAGRDWQLRPHVPLVVYVRLDLWEAIGRGESQDAA